MGEYNVKGGNGAGSFRVYFGGLRGGGHLWTL